jgi:putative ABC transport system permease protein
LRIHRTRVLLSLIGVAIAVTAITVVVGAGALLTQSQIESSERGSGRPAMISINAYKPSDGTQAPIASMEPVFDQVVERYKVTYSGRSSYLDQSVQLPTGVRHVSGYVVDPDYGTMHRVKVVQGRWFTDADQDRLAPVVIINEEMWRQLGSPPLATHPTVEFTGAKPSTAIVIGITPSPIDYAQPEATVLFDDWLDMTTPEQQAMYGASFELWVPPELASQLVDLVQRDVAGAFGPDYEVNVNRNDYLSYQDGDPLLGLKLAVGGIAGLVLLLGALGLVNISLVTVGQRIREIGIRRSFGATAGRVFFSVLMESVVATLAAGVIGVAVAIAIVQNPWIQERLGGGLIDAPPFPIEAAIFGLAASAGVGALAGLLPAIVAIRVKVIDAIRY